MSESDRDRFDDADLQLPAKTEPKAIEATVVEEESNKDEITVADILRTSGHIKLTKKQEEILYAPIERERVQIRSDGIVYMPWVEYAKRLRKAFGINYRFIPATIEPSNINGHIYWGFWFVIEGSVIGYALGEQRYQPNNPIMSYADAIEGAKSNARMRVCKDIGLFPEMWEPDWIKEWKDEFAICRTVDKKPVWSKKGQKASKTEAGPDPFEKSASIEQEPPSPSPEPQKSPPPKTKKPLPPANVQIGDDPKPVEYLKTKCKAEFSDWDTFLQFLVRKGCVEVNPVSEKPDITTLTYGNARFFYENFPDLKAFKQELKAEEGEENG